MKNYILYDPTTGEIRSYGICQDVDFSSHATNGLSLIEGQGTPLTHYVSNGQLTAYTTLQATIKASVPQYFALWSNTTFSWIDQRSLSEIQSNKWQSIKQTRDSQIFLPKVTSVGSFDANLDAQNNLNKVIALVQLAQAKGLPATANYTLSDNSRVSLTLSQLQTAALEMGAQVQALYDKADILRTQINAATTIDQVNSIIWPA